MAIVKNNLRNFFTRNIVMTTQAQHVLRKITLFNITGT